MTKRRLAFALSSIMLCTLLTHSAFAGETKQSPAQPASPNVQSQAGASAAPLEPPLEPPPDSQQAEKLIKMLQYAHDLMDPFAFKYRDDIASTAGEATPSEASEPKTICNKAWADFYSKDKIDIRIAFGFIDSETSKKSSDALLRAVLIGQLTRSCTRALPECTAKPQKPGDPQKCQSNVRACEFKRSPSDMDLLTKEIIGPTGKTHTVELRIKGSSSSADSMGQDFDSAVAEKFYHEALTNSDAVFYLGHARKGGGPSFGPALRRRDGSIDYDKYQRDRSGYDKMLDGLRSAKTPPKIVGVLACDAQRLFRVGMLREVQKSGMVLATTADTPQSLLTRAYFSIDSILWARCQNGFNASLNAMKDYDGNLLTPMQLERFFESQKPD